MLTSTWWFSSSIMANGINLNSLVMHEGQLAFRIWALTTIATFLHLVLLLCDLSLGFTTKLRHDKGNEMR